MRSMMNPATLKSWALVMAQFSLLGLLLFYSQLESFNCACLFAIVLGGLLGLWAIVAIGLGNFNIHPQVKDDARLVHQNLPYRYIRHPMYSSFLLFCLGLVFMPYLSLKLFIWCLLLLVLIIKSQYEEQLLCEKFPDYRRYQQQSWRFIPFIY
ncbi:methyltransferase family protein [Candidatus Venteria ishoeyi]|uniref:Isoprenylcysteine carboxyl methyltransferase (ICMT) family protein n=1 Tax=Candidatus Venteria ishoeyi TaxID=1899563 RepID=A0A1H6FG35_9GAMM|nr:isoprenylcysteine carboxylmethyltransferase family protein [Candidatus Venteria ishoeyi]MDM8547688.1 isoprenylcysteine carboxylmethyltransferase family protein [Candidatus Venteria ishoeyi]SEH09038.1 Isoprenylcysteine carboxyl methyltransferase (ICMT) family protein [Candidatus Venteria ishoeyi]